MKQALSALSKDQRRQMIAYLVAIGDSDKNVYRKKLAKKIDEPASKFATLGKLNRRLGLT